MPDDIEAIRQFVDGLFEKARDDAFWRRAALPSWVAVPEQEQGIDDDETTWVPLQKATVRDVQTFLTHEPDWLGPEARTILTAMVEYAVREHEPGDILFTVLDRSSET